MGCSIPHVIELTYCRNHVVWTYKKAKPWPLTVITKPRDWMSEWWYCSEICQASRLLPRRLSNVRTIGQHISRGFKFLRNLAIRHPSTQCITSLMPAQGSIYSSMIPVKQPCRHASRWWYHQVDTFSALLALCEGNPPVTGGFPSQRPVTRSFEIFFDLRLNKRLITQPKRRWFETPLRSLWRHCNDHVDLQKLIIRV